MELFKCQQCGRKFNSQEELRKHEQECLPARVKYGAGPRREASGAASGRPRGR